MARHRIDEQSEAIGEVARPIPHEGHHFNELLDEIDDARIVLIGEASHGTHEFYDARAAITRQLIERKGFTAVVAEADWPSPSDAKCILRWCKCVRFVNILARSVYCD